MDLKRWCLCVLTLFCSATSWAEEIRLLGRVDWPGTAIDASGLLDSLGDVPHRRLGGFSGIEYLGQDHLYAVLADRGPKDGAVPYRCRYHVVRLEPREMGESGWLIEAQLQQAFLLTNSTGSSLLGALSALDLDVPTKSLRFDPEAIRLTSDGHLLISDEYGPDIGRFGQDGRLVQRLPIPEKFLVRQPAITPSAEAEANKTGRQPNGGFESLGVAPDGAILAMNQRPLIQDSERGPAGKRPGRNLRLVRFESNGNTAEYVYRLEHPRFGTNELLVVGNSSALVIERDSEAGSEAVAKRIYWIDWSAATDVSAVSQLPAGELPAAIVPVRKRLLIDLLDPKFHLVGKTCPEKFEGLAFGPRLPDGSRLLVVTVDNDFKEDTASVFLFFSVPENSLSP